MLKDKELDTVLRSLKELDAVLRQFKPYLTVTACCVQRFARRRPCGVVSCSGTMV